MAAEEERVDPLVSFIHSTPSISPSPLSVRQCVHSTVESKKQQGSRKQSEMKHSN